MRIENLRQTCQARPSQWEFRTDENRPVYVRYRNGYLSVLVGKPEGQVSDAIFEGVELVGEELGGEYDGVIEWYDVEKRIKDITLQDRLSPNP